MLYCVVLFPKSLCHGLAGDFAIGYVNAALQAGIVFNRLEHTFIGNLQRIRNRNVG
ncbi:hypothetical protein D3C85_1939000 [compost metagenome]